MQRPWPDFLEGQRRTAVSDRLQHTLCRGSRKNALEHMDAAYINGFSSVLDGLPCDHCRRPARRRRRGGSGCGRRVCENAKSAGRLMDADIVLSLTHFKGHEQAGYGGTLKNIGMGGGCARGQDGNARTGQAPCERTTVSAAADARRSAPTARPSSRIKVRD